MDIIYQISDYTPSYQQSQGLALGITVSVTRNCPLGMATMKWTVASLGQAATVAGEVLAWIAADTASLATMEATLIANQAMQEAFELLVGDLTITVTI